MLSDHFWKMMNRAFGLILVTAVFAVTAFSAAVEIKDYDLWLHLAMGRYILDSGYVPYVDVLSNSVAGHWWVNHEWLFQIIVAFIQRAFNYNGLIFMQIGVVMITYMVLIFITYRRENYFLNAIILLIVMMIYQQRFTIRPDIYSILFLSIYMVVAMRCLKYRWSVYVIFVTQALWINMHGLSFLGHFVLFIFLAAEFIKRRVPLPYEWNQTERLSDKAYGHLKVAFVLSIVGSCVNPLFIEGAWGPIQHILIHQGESKEFFKYITELRKPFPWPDFFNFNDQRYYKILIVLSAVSAVLSRRRLHLGLLGVCGLMFIFSQVAVRNLIYFGVLAHIMIVYHMVQGDWRRLLPVRFVSYRCELMGSLILRVALIFWIMNYVIKLSGGGYYDFDIHARKNETLGVSKRTYPYKGADFLEQNNIHGRFWNGFNSGAYLLGRTFPQIKVYIDGRSEPYGFDHFQKYLDVWHKGDEQLFDAEVKQFDLTGVLLNAHYQDIPRPVLEMMLGKKEWKLVYFDYDAVIFLKDIPENQRWIEQYAFDIADWKATDVDLREYGVARVSPYPYVNRAKMLRIADEEDKALKEVNQALTINPSYAPAYMVRGKIYGEREEYEKAYEDFRLASIFSYGGAEARKQLVQTHYYLNEVDEAMDQVNVLLDYYPQDPFNWFLLARLEIKKGDYHQAWRAIDKGVTLNGKDYIPDLIALGDDFLEVDQEESAEKILLKAHEINEKEIDPVKKLIAFYEKRNDQEKLVLFIEKAADLEPDEAEWSNKLKKLSPSI